MKKEIRPNAYDVTKALRDMAIGDVLVIPHRVLSEAKVRQRCTRLKEKGYLYQACLDGPDRMLVTRLK